MSISDLANISKNFAEPAWLLRFREERLNEGETLPKTFKYGIGIAGVPPEGEVSFDQTVDYHVDASKGLELYTWEEAVSQEEIAPILEGLMKSKLFPTATNYYGGLGQALFRSGLVVYAQPTLEDDGVSKEEKLTLGTVVPKGNSADLIVVIVKEGARLSFESSLKGGIEGSVFARTIVVLTERDARVHMTQTSSLSKGTMALLSSRGIVAAHSSVTWNQVFSGEVSVKSETEHLLIGEGAKGEIREVLIADESAKYDIYSSVKHLADHTHSHIHAAGIALGVSKTVYRGMVDVNKGVRAVLGRQEARFLLLSPQAEVDAIPSLDIASKEVQCTHKLSISHIRDTDTFYPKLRGLSDHESRNLFLEGTFAEVFPGEENEPIMKEIRAYLGCTGKSNT